MTGPTVFQYFGYGASLAVILGFIGAIAYHILAGKFVTPTELNTHCTLKQEACKPSFCGKIEQVRREISAMDRKREKARSELTAQLKEIHTFMGDVSRYMKDH